MPAMTFESVLGKATEPTGCGVLVVRDGRILTGTRKEKASRGQICGPGGHIEPGETPKEAARREAYEEFGIICEDLKPLGVKDGGRHGRSAVFMCNRFRGTPKTDEEEMTDPEWLTIDEIKERNLFKPFEQSLELMPREKVIKFNPYHSPADGKFTSGPGGGGMTHTITYGTGKSYNTDERTKNLFEEQKKYAVDIAMADSKSEIFNLAEKLFSKYQEGTANKDNFFVNTIAEFKELKRRPRRKPDYVSYTRDGKVSSEYWYEKDGVIRGSNHWGSGIASCDWFMEGKGNNMHGSKMYGKASWSDFIQKPEIMTSGNEAKMSTFANTVGGIKRKRGFSDPIIEGFNDNYNKSFTFDEILKFNPYHSPADGKFTSGPGGSSGSGDSNTSARQKEIDSLKQEFANTKGLIARSKLKNKIEALENGYDDVEEWKKVKAERQQAKIAESKARQEAKEKAEKEKEAERKEAERKEIEREMQTQPKQKVDQFKIIQENNPMLDDYHVGIRKPSDIKTWKEVIDSDDGSGESFAWGDFSQKDAKAALKSGKITIYSSYPINQGVFVSTSKVQAEEYAGGKGKKVYSKTVPLDDVAWINGDEGQFAKVSAVRKSATFNEILKFNPNHDHLGRFSSGPGGGSAVSDMKISTFSTGASGDEVYMRSEMKDGDKLAGYVKYSIYDGVPAIQYIHTEDDYKRQGVATKLLQDLQRQYPDKEIDFGMTTDDGTKLLDSITYEVKNEKVAAQKKELKSLKDEMTRNEAELNRLYDKLEYDTLTDAENKKLDKLGERWDELEDGIRNLEDELWGKKETMRFVRLDDTKKSITGGEDMSKDFTIFKADEDKHLVFGWASISVTIDGQELEDRQHDIIEPEDLEEAAYEYVLDFRDTGEEHIETMRKRGRLIESCVFTKEKQRAIGIPEGVIPVGWWVGFKIDDEDAWRRVKSGMYKMFSIEGRANRKPVEKASQDDLDSKTAKSFNDVLEKFNPYHDQLGRFSTANGGVSFTWRTKDPSKQHWADMAAAREKDRTKDWKNTKKPESKPAEKPTAKPTAKPDTSNVEFKSIDTAGVREMQKEMGQKYTREDINQMNRHNGFEGYFGTGNSFDINESLRDGMKISELSDDDRKTCETLDRNMKPITRDIKLVRMVDNGFFEQFGIDQNKVNSDPSELQKAVGKVYANKGYSSTSYDIDKNVFTSRKFKLNISAPKGTNVVIRPGHSEAEILLARNTGMVVKGIRKTGRNFWGDTYDVDVEVIV